MEGKWRTGMESSDVGLRKIKKKQGEEEKES